MISLTTEWDIIYETPYRTSAREVIVFYVYEISATYNTLQANQAVSYPEAELTFLVYSRMCSWCHGGRNQKKCASEAVLNISNFELFTPSPSIK